MSASSVRTNYEMLAREAKAAKIAEFLRGIGVTGQDIRDARGADDYEECWAQVARETQTKPASPETRRRVVEILGGR